MEAFARLDHQIEEALSERDPAKRDQLSERTIGDACQLLNQLMIQPSFAAAMSSIENQDPGVIVAAIGQLRAGDVDDVVAELGELLNRAGIPRWSIRRATLEAITCLLTGDSTALVGPQGRMRQSQISA